MLYKHWRSSFHQCSIISECPKKRARPRGGLVPRRLDPRQIFSPKVSPRPPRNTGRVNSCSQGTLNPRENHSPDMNTPHGMTPLPVVVQYVDTNGNYANATSASGLPISGGSGGATPTTGTTGQFTTSTTATAITGLGSDTARKGVVILNADNTNTVYIGFNTTNLATTGYILYPGATYRNQTSAALFAQSAAGTPVLSWSADKA